MHSNLRFSKAMYATAGMVFLAGIGTAFHPLTAKGIGNDVVMERNTPLMDVIAQAKKITGKVTDDQGEPLPGATVRVKGTTKDRKSVV